MASIIIQSDNSDNMELIVKLAEKLGINVSNVTNEFHDDLALGTMMIKTKTGKTVSRDAIMKKLQK